MATTAHRPTTVAEPGALRLAAAPMALAGLAFIESASSSASTGDLVDRRARMAV